MAPGGTCVTRLSTSRSFSLARMLQSGLLVGMLPPPVRLADVVWHCLCTHDLPLRQSGGLIRRSAESYKTVTMASAQVSAGSMTRPERVSGANGRAGKHGGRPGRQIRRPAPGRGPAPAAARPAVDAPLAKPGESAGSYRSNWRITATSPAPALFAAWVKPPARAWKVPGIQATDSTSIRFAATGSTAAVSWPPE